MAPLAFGRQIASVQLVDAWRLDGGFETLDIGKRYELVPGVVEIHTRRSTGDRCDRWTLRWDQVRYQHTQAVRSKLADKYEPATANKMLSALRGVLKEAWRLGQVGAENYHRAVDLPSGRGESPLRGRALTAGELRKIAAVCAEDLSPAGPRDAAMIALSTAGGLRCGEIINLDVKAHAPETGALTIRRGKGRKPRICYATNGAADALADWLQLRGSDAGALFCPVSQKGQIIYRHMIGHAFHVICAKRARQAGVKAFTPHDGRRTFISDLLDAGADISLVQRLAGHANVTTTARYDRRPEEAKKRHPCCTSHMCGGRQDKCAAHCSRRSLSCYGNVAAPVVAAAAYVFGLAFLSPCLDSPSATIPGSQGLEQHAQNLL